MDLMLQHEPEPPSKRQFHRDVWYLLDLVHICIGQHVEVGQCLGTSRCEVATQLADRRKAGRKVQPSIVPIMMKQATSVMLLRLENVDEVLSTTEQLRSRTPRHKAPTTT